MSRVDTTSSQMSPPHQTFTIPTCTNGAPDLRACVFMYQNRNRVQLSRAEPGEEY